MHVVSLNKCQNLGSFLHFDSSREGKSDVYPNDKKEVVLQLSDKCDLLSY